MAGIEQLQLVFNPEQDRLLLRVNTSDQEQLRFWLTRRLVKRLTPSLQSLLQSANDVPELQDRPLNDNAKQALFDMEHQAIRDQVDFATEFRDEVESLPLGSEGILVNTVKVTTQKGATPDQHQYALKLSDEKGASVDINLNNQLLHSLYAVLVEGIRKTDWDLSFGTAGHPSGISPDDAVGPTGSSGPLH